MVPRFGSVFLAVPWKQLLANTRRHRARTAAFVHVECAPVMKSELSRVEFPRRMVDVYRKQVSCIPTVSCFRFVSDMRSHLLRHDCQPRIAK